MAGLVGRKLGRYEVSGFVGRGGMGEVYRARDTELGRDVAVKVLPAETAKDETRLRRFKREARAVAQLSHPNILDIYDFGTDGGVSYSVTELLDGSDLRERLNGPPLPISKVLKISRAVAEGLAAAHGKGIVHRDIKPANIFVAKTGHVKILDFGIASLKRGFAAEDLAMDAPTKTLTEVGQIVGTAAYMSPEQVAGRPADARSDIFSLGCVLYEMLGGKRAFGGDTPQETMVAIVSQDPTPLVELRPEVPYALDHLIKRCLEKEPGERFESARDVAFALETLSDDRAPSMPEVVRIPAWARFNLRPAAVGAAVVIAAMIAWNLLSPVLPSTPELPVEKHIAVLDFDYGSDHPDREAFSRGLSEHLANGLRFLEQDLPRSFWVSDRELARRMGVDSIEAARKKFNVNLVVSGKIRDRNDVLELDLDIVDVATGRVIRTSSIEDRFDNIGSFQLMPVLRVCEMLGLEVSSEAELLLNAGGTTIPAALEAYFTGVGELVSGGDAAATDRAAGDLERALQEDTLFADARIALARTHLRRFKESSDRAWIETGLRETATAADVQARRASALAMAASLHVAGENVGQAIANLEEAVRLEPADSGLHISLGLIYEDSRRYDDASAAYQRAIFLRPGWWIGHLRLAFLYQTLGRYEACATEFQKVIDTIPESRFGYTNLGQALFDLGRYAEAEQLLEESIAIEPTFTAYSNLGVLYFESSRFADAVSMFENAVALYDGDYFIWGNLAYANRFGGSPEQADEHFQRAFEMAQAALESDPDDAELLINLAGYCAMLDERERGLDYLNEAVAQEPGDPKLIASVAEAFEDLGDRDNALVWVEMALERGVRPERFDGRPTLRDLIADERYRTLIEGVAGL